MVGGLAQTLSGGQWQTTLEGQSNWEHHMASPGPVKVTHST